MASPLPPSSPPRQSTPEDLETDHFDNNFTLPSVDSDNIPLGPPPVVTSDNTPLAPPPNHGMIDSDDMPLAPPLLNQVDTQEDIELSNEDMTRAERNAKKQKKAGKKGAATRAVNRALSIQQQERDQQIGVEKSLEVLETHGVTLMDLMTAVFDPDRGNGTHHWNFFRKSGNATTILNFWVSPKNAKQATLEVTNWAADYVAKQAAGDARYVTSDGILQSLKKPVTLENILSFNFQDLTETFHDTFHPGTMSVVRALADNPRRHKTQTLARKARTEQIVTSSILALLGEYSLANNFHRKVNSLFLYATGTQRQTISTLAHVGFCESYTNLIARDTQSKGQREKDQMDREAGKEVAPPKGGTLKQLSDSCREAARKSAEEGIDAEIFDNINMRVDVAEQVIGRHGTQENGTCVTRFRLHKTKPEDLELAAFQKAFDEAGPLTLTDILLKPDEEDMFRDCLLACIIRIIISYGGESFKHFEDEIKEFSPHTEQHIDSHLSGPMKLYPLPAFNIDESTIVGNIEVDEAIVKELRLREHRWFWERVRIKAGDQLSIARLRAIVNLRAGKEGGYSSFNWGVWMPGLFHTKIADMHGIFTTHWGKANCGNRNPGCLAFHNSQMNRLPISPTSLPTFRTCRDLVFTSLYARVLHCLLLVSKHSTLDECAREIGNDFEKLRMYAQEIYETFASSSKVSQLRWEQAEPAKPRKGDMVYEGALLFMRDALISREFSDAIKAGDSGCVLLVLKVWALSFRGNGRSKYAYEMFHIIHNLTHVWPKPIVDVVLNNWLLNPSGNPNSYVEADLVQEHMNFWIKTYYKAHGSNASWEWLEMIAPCVQALRHISNMMKSTLGVDIGTKHSTPNLSDDIYQLMKSLDENNVYRVHEGRTIDNSDLPVVDVISVGLQSLKSVSKNPLSEYNKTFSRLQVRSRIHPITGDYSPFSAHPPEPNIVPHTLEEPLGVIPVTDSHTRNGSDAGSEGSEASDLELGNDLEDTELDRLLDEDDEPTLGRMSLEDVALDMDVIEDEELVFDNFNEDVDGDD
ncbi:hypothetical protein K435DRAFT_820517 [Dendrothele bispora CBS 962.96]|uniref:DUF6589 domain-containing protein n=1 Tax=Dendrothele bispora (strain CBS 962.96) TaxID=1314807 RepID=A0A4V4HEU1_DENBC|nr:hypothetical protein K435DRAFT_820517 [Dendrothele bispora CBS 962.96]